MDTYKPATARPSLPAILTVLAGVVALGIGVALGRWTAPSHAPSASSPVAAGIRYVDGTPTGFAHTARGAGDAAAWFETLISAASSRPHDEVQALITRLVDPDVGQTLASQLMPSSNREGNDNISETVVARVWAEGAANSADVAAGTQVSVKTYGAGLLGSRTDGHISSPTAGLGGGFVVHAMVMRLTSDGWRLHAVDTPKPAPPPDLRGLTRDGGPRDTQVLAEVLGPDSWVPYMP